MAKSIAHLTSNLHNGTQDNTYVRNQTNWKQRTWMWQ